jgi:GNAT superfamily N-acetyltransferase
MTESRYALTLSDDGSSSLQDAIVAPLREYNTSKAGPSGRRALTVAVTDAAGAVIGGMWGHTAYEWLFTQVLVVPERLRGRGIGAEIMQLAEQEALDRGCHSAWLDTFEFQARGFYDRIGYECFAELPNYPTGFSSFHMRKALKGNFTCTLPSR